MENENILSETGHGTGAIFKDLDSRDWIFGKQFGDASVPFDWETGYDVEADLSAVLGSPTLLYVNDQGPSFSCGGQASSKKGEVIAAFHNKKYVRKSAKFPYAQVFVGRGGSGADDLYRIAKSQGFCDESVISSYDMGQPPTEPFMQRKGDITPDSVKNANADRATAYAQVTSNIDSVAQAIREQKGVIIGIYGINNGTWRSAYPIAPGPNVNPARDLWAHWVYAGKAKMINGNKYIGILNSWGKATGDQGWQWITEDYFNAKWGIWQIWTMLYNTVPVLANPIFSQTLHYGMPKNGDVKKLQYILGIPDDGIFKNQTLAAVKAFQSSHGLKVDGIVGELTQSAIKQAYNL